MTDAIRRYIPWHPSPDGGPLGRHVQHDPASRGYAVTAAPGALRSGLWTRHVPIYDQGTIGDCTANAISGAVSTGRLKHHILSQRTIPAPHPGPVPHTDPDTGGVKRLARALDYSWPILGGLAGIVHSLVGDDRMARWLRTKSISVSSW